MATDSKERFSNRVEDYVRYRPGYPHGVLDALRDGCGLTAESVVVDVGSGTGLLAQLFLENGNVVYGVEPNAAMRDAGEQVLEKYPHFCSVAGSAEATTLPDACADFVVAGQAFHWLEPKAARAEFDRILRPGGWVAVIWNERVSDRTAFQREYAALLREYCDDYAKVAETYPQYARMKEFFGRGADGEKLLPNEQVFDFDGLRGRLLSSSYAPRAGHRKHEPMLAALREIFDRHAEDGRVRFEYQTHVYYGRLEASGDS
ncbi:MAG TPA: class I SAM-dependent methyltransferase [Candidatus Acidoferrales bacterium]|nr:class I SAM-dependent methyltransferase [Candidatus Acidoferrales bacterium]